MSMTAVSLINPCLTRYRFIKTKILSQATVDKLTAGGVVFAEAEDAALAAIRLCADPNATGKCT